MTMQRRILLPLALALPLGACLPVVDQAQRDADAEVARRRAALDVCRGRNACVVAPQQRAVAAPQPPYNDAGAGGAGGGGGGSVAGGGGGGDGRGVGLAN